MPVEYVPPPGIDKHTQIPVYDWDLHDFDIEVEPVLQVLVGRNLEQARIELIEESEQAEYRAKRKQFEVRRHAELMKTQRMDEAYRRENEEDARRQLQRTAHLENRREAHCKMYSRALAKGLLEGLETVALDTGEAVGRTCDDSGCLRDEFEAAVKGRFYDWLVAGATAEVARVRKVETGMESMVEKPGALLVEVHEHYIEIERRRLQRIEDAQIEERERFDEERRKRRERRALLRVQRTKRRLKEEVEAKVVSRRTNELDVLGVKLVAFNKHEEEPKRWRSFGGAALEISLVLTRCKRVLNSRIETPSEGFLLEEDMKKFLIHFLAESGLKEGGLRVDIKEKYRPLIEEALAEMEADLIAFNESVHDTIERIVQHDDLLDDFCLDFCLEYQYIEREVYKSFLKYLFLVFFKSNDYKIVQPPEAKEPIDDGKADGGDLYNGDDNKDGGDDKGNDDKANDDKVSQAPPGQTGPLTTMSGEGSHNNVQSSASVRKAPEITEEDRKIEILKKKLDIVFTDSSTQSIDFEYLFRIQEQLDREDFKQSVLQEMKEKAAKKKEEKEAIVDEKATLEYHKKQYLLDEYLESVKKEEERQREAEEEEEAKRMAEYIEPFDGSAYENDFKLYDILEADRPPTNINESIETGVSVLFINYVNQYLFRRSVFDRLRETFKELSLIKDMSLRKEMEEVDRAVYEVCLNHIKSHSRHEVLTIYDTEI